MTGKEITCKDLDLLAHLDAEEFRIGALSGLEFAMHLEVFDFGDKGLTEVVLLVTFTLLTAVEDIREPNQRSFSVVRIGLAYELPTLPKPAKT